MSLQPQSIRIPLGYVGGHGGAPVYMNEPWYQYLVTDSFDRNGGSVALSNAELEALFRSRSPMMPDDEGSSVGESATMMMPGPPGNPGSTGAPGMTIYIEPDSQSEPVPMFSTAMANLPILASGKYTPTLTGVANVAASTAYECQYLRVGNVVTVSGKVDVDPTAAVSTQLGISLPIPSNFGAAEDCGGCAFAPAIAGQGAAILADTANDRMQMQWIAVDVTNQPMCFTATYEVI